GHESSWWVPLERLSRNLRRRLAIDANTDRRGHRAGLAAHPGRDHRAKTAGRSTRSHHQKIVGRAERTVDLFGAVAHDGAFADRGPISPLYPRALEQEFGDVAFAPAGTLDRLAQLLGDDDHVVAAIDRVVQLVGAHLGGERLKDLARIGR